ncbi:hypothetical protein ACWET9_44130 [Streptomyces sp. NPDC004059]
MTEVLSPPTELGTSSLGNPLALGKLPGSTAVVDFWCETLFGLTGTHSDKDIPIKQSWLTVSVTLRWTSHGWRLADYGQKDGPDPEAGQFGTAPQL